MADQLMGSGLTSRILERSLASIKKLEQAGKLTPIRTVEGTRLYRAEQVHALAESLKAQNGTSKNQ